MTSERSESQDGRRSASGSQERMPPEAGEHVPRTTEDRGESVGEPDVLLDVPVLKVEELDLEVEDLRARISFGADLADMVRINVGIDAEVGSAKIEIKGIEAQALLKARLDNVRAIFSEVLTALQRDPELAQNMLRATDPSKEDGAGTVRDAARPGEAADRAGGLAFGEAGSTPHTGAEPDEAETATGGSVGVVGEEKSNNLANLRTEEEYVDDRGRIVGRARDESGRVGEAVLDEDGNVPGSGAPAQAEPGEDEGLVEATDAARRRADELGLDLSGLKGTGSGGRVLVKDVEEAGKMEDKRP